MTTPSVDDVQVRVRLSDGSEEWWPLDRVFRFLYEDMRQELRKARAKSQAPAVELPDDQAES